MKKLYALLTMGLFFVTTACADDIISRNVNDLPAQARTTLNKHFSGKKVSYIKIDKEIVQSTTYEVKLENGTDVKFDSKGNWTEVDGNHRPVPAVFIPKQIKKTANDMFPDASIIKIEKDHRGWEIELSNDMDIKFDKKFNVRKVD